jgi:hypothetical protein
MYDRGGCFCMQRLRGACIIGKQLLRVNHAAPGLRNGLSRLHQIGNVAACATQAATD